MDVAHATKTECQKAAARRSAAATKYRPQKIRLLLVAQMPPDELDRYFYFEDVPKADYLFRAVVPHLLGEEPLKLGKGPQLAKLRDLGVYLVDLKPDPCAPGQVESYADDLVERVTALHSEQAILIKVDVWAAAATKLEEAGVKVVPARLPFPSTGQQGQFRKGFQKALDDAGWESKA